MRVNSQTTTWAIAMTVAVLALAPTAFAANPPTGAGSGHLTLDGTPSVLLTNDQRTMLGIKFGPDTPINFFQARNGNFYLNSAGSLGPIHGPGRPAAWNLHVDRQLTRILALHSDAPATGPDDVQTIMTTHADECGSARARVRATDANGAACTQYFDRDYAGGGGYFRCPDNATSVYFYHGENHTAPDGTWGHGGWFGIGVGYFNPDETAVTRARQMKLAGGRSSAQIIGLNLSTIWQGSPGAYPNPPQQNPFNGVPSVVAAPDGYLYVFHGNATNDPAYNPSACRPECMSVSRAPIGAFCSSIKTATPVTWQNYDRGTWSQPAVQDATSPLGLGAGGAFTPSISHPPPGEHGGTVTYLPARHLYVMTRLMGGGIDAHYSADGINWGEARELVDAPQGATPNGDPEQIVYPKVSVVHDARGDEQYVVTYSLVTKGHFWKWAALIRQPLVFAAR